MFQLLCGSAASAFDIYYRNADSGVSHSKLLLMANNIYLNLFDEVIVDILEDDRRRSTTIHHRIERRWLGKFTLPFSTLILRKMVTVLISVALIHQYIEPAREFVEITVALPTNNSQISTPTGPDIIMMRLLQF